MRNARHALIREAGAKQESELVFFCRFAPKSPVTFTSFALHVQGNLLGKCLGRI